MRPIITQSKKVDTLEKFFPREEVVSEESTATVKPFQTAVKPGNYFVRIAKDKGIAVYGEILDPTPIPVSEKGLSTEELAELHAEQAALTELWTKSSKTEQYKFSRCYSQECPEGELGDIHITAIDAIIPKIAFEDARLNGWPCNMGYIVGIATTN